MAAREDFAQLADPFRQELLAYCYRMLGSVHDAEDLVQETYLRAWRSYDAFEGRSSLRTWLYRIATNACLRALESGARRVLPAALGAPGDDLAGPLSRLPEVTWLEPFPLDPADVVSSRNGLRLALIAALQHLPPRQRVVLILREVLAWSAAEGAELLDTSTAAVNSALQRARAQLERESPQADEIGEPVDPEQRALLERYVEAFENVDIAALEKVLTEDAVWEMPPVLTYFAGRRTVAALIESRLGGSIGPGLLVPVAANDQPAYAYYARSADGRLRAHSIQLLTVTGAGISHVVAFHSPRLFGRFGLPLLR